MSSGEIPSSEQIEIKEVKGPEIKELSRLEKTKIILKNIPESVKKFLTSEDVSDLNNIGDQELRNQFDDATTKRDVRRVLRIVKQMAKRWRITPLNALASLVVLGIIAFALIGGGLLIYDKSKITKSGEVKNISAIKGARGAKIDRRNQNHKMLSMMVDTTMHQKNNSR